VYLCIPYAPLWCGAEAQGQLFILFGQCEVFGVFNHKLTYVSDTDFKCLLDHYAFCCLGDH
jgi:hypothetical protein